MGFNITDLTGDPRLRLETTIPNTPFVFLKEAQSAVCSEQLQISKNKRLANLNRSLVPIDGISDSRVKCFVVILRPRRGIKEDTGLGESGYGKGSTFLPFSFKTKPKEKYRFSCPASFPLLFNLTV